MGKKETGKNNKKKLAKSTVGLGALCIVGSVAVAVNHFMQDETTTSLSSEVKQKVNIEQTVPASEPKTKELDKFVSSSTPSVEEKSLTQANNHANEQEKQMNLFALLAQAQLDRNLNAEVESKEENQSIDLIKNLPQAVEEITFSTTSPNTQEGETPSANPSEENTSPSENQGGNAGTEATQPSIQPSTENTSSNAQEGETSNTQPSTETTSPSENQGENAGSEATQPSTEPNQTPNEEVASPNTQEGENQGESVGTEATQPSTETTSPSENQGETTGTNAGTEATQPSTNPSETPNEEVTSPTTQEGEETTASPSEETTSPSENQGESAGTEVTQPSTNPSEIPNEEVVSPNTQEGGTSNTNPSEETTTSSSEETTSPSENQGETAGTNAGSEATQPSTEPNQTPNEEVASPNTQEGEAPSENQGESAGTETAQPSTETTSPTTQPGETPSENQGETAGTNAGSEATQSSTEPNQTPNEEVTSPTTQPGEETTTSPSENQGESAGTEVTQPSTENTSSNAQEGETSNTSSSTETTEQQGENPSANQGENAGSETTQPSTNPSETPNEEVASPNTQEGENQGESVGTEATQPSTETTSPSENQGENAGSETTQPSTEPNQTPNEEVAAPNTQEGETSNTSPSTETTSPSENQGETAGTNAGSEATQPSTEPNQTPSEESTSPSENQGESAGTEATQPSTENTSSNAQEGETSNTSSSTETTEQQGENPSANPSEESTSPSENAGSEATQPSTNPSETPNEEVASPNTQEGEETTASPSEETTSPSENQGESAGTEVTQPSTNPSETPNEEVASPNTQEGETPSETPNEEVASPSTQEGETSNTQPSTETTEQQGENPSANPSEENTSPSENQGEAAGTTAESTETAQPSTETTSQSENQGESAGTEATQPSTEPNQTPSEETTASPSENQGESAGTETAQPSANPSEEVTSPNTQQGETPSANPSENQGENAGTTAETAENTESELPEDTCGLEPSEEGPCSLQPDTQPSTTEIDPNDPFAPQAEFENIPSELKPFLRVENNKTHTQFITKENSTRVSYQLEDPNELFVKAVAKLYVNDKVVKEITVLKNQLKNNKFDVRFGELENNVDYHVRTELVYRDAQNNELTSRINDVVQVDFEDRERKLEIKNVDEVELWRVHNEKSVRKLKLRYEPNNELEKYYAVLKSDENKDIQLPIKKIKQVSKEGQDYFEVEVDMMNLTSQRETDAKTSNGLKFYVPKEEASEKSFDDLIQEMRQNPYSTFTLTHDLTASEISLSEEAESYLDQFSGTLEGNGYKIHDLKAPLFKNLNGTVKDVVLSDVEIYKPNKEKIGSLTKEAGQNARIENVNVTGSIVAKNFIGGIAAEVYSGARLSNVHFKGSLTSTEKISTSNHIGGIAAWLGMNGTIEKGYADVSISAVSSNFNIGGLVGQMEYTNAKILSSYATGRINHPITLGANVGGLVGTILSGENIKIKDSIAAVDTGLGNKVYGSSDNAQERFENISIVKDKAIGKDNQQAREITLEDEKNKLSELFPIAQKELTVVEKYNKYDINYRNQKHIREDRLLAYENMEKLLPFFTRDVIIQHANRLSKNDSLVHKKLLDAVPMITKDGKDVPLFDVMGIEDNGREAIHKVRKIEKVLLHFEDGSVEYHYVQRRPKEVSRGAIVEYHFIDKNISYTPEVLLFESAYKTLLRELSNELSAVNWTSAEVNRALNLTSNLQTEKESLLLKDSFEKVKNERERHLSELISNYNLVGLHSQVAREQLKKYVKENRAKVLLGLAYMDRWYGIEHDQQNAKDFMMKKADFFGENINSLDQIIRVGGLGAEMLKPKNNAVVAGQVIAKESVRGDLFDYLEGYRKAFSPEKSNADWFNHTTSANVKVIETDSEIETALAKQKNSTDKKYSNRFYDKLSHASWRHPEIALLLLNLPKDQKSMYVLTNMTSTAIGSYGKYTSLPKENIDQKLEEMAVKMAKHADFWYSVLPEHQKDEMFRNVIVWDSDRNDNGRMRTEKTNFYQPLNLNIRCQTNAGACADSEDIYYVGYDLVGEQGSTTYTHELVHVLEKIYMLDHATRNGLGPESFALGFLQSLRWSNQDTIGINSVYDHSKEIERTPGKQLTNASPDRFKSTQDLEKYMKNYFDVLYTLDYLEADAVLNSGNTYAKQNYFNKMEVKDEAGKRNVTEVRRVSDNNAQNINELIEKGLVSRRSYDPSGNGNVSYQTEYDAYLEVNALNPIYGSLNNDGVQRNEYEFRKLAFELLAEYGYEHGFVPYASNQYVNEFTEVGQRFKAFADSKVIKKITGNYETSAEFRKAMFERRINNLSKLRSIQIVGGENGYHYNGNQTVNGLDDLRRLMQEAVQYDMANNKYNAQSSNNYNLMDSRVYRLKAALLNGFLRATNEFRESIYNEPTGQN